MIFFSVRKIIVIKQHNKKGIKFITGDLYINFKLGFITYEKKKTQ
ncbi:hypothetical protein ECSTECDG1313_3006 [Escherichia coli STEC_DG131-3]|nr:hypothetical protein ECSTECDG1313_3006 [Escherichia coli STEC_DG131-3]